MLYLAYKNLITKPLNTVLSVLLLLLSISLATFVLQVRNQFDQHLKKNSKPFDMVIGAKGSPLQLILSSLLHIDNPTGNISLKEALKIGNNPMVKEMIPVSYGDNYNGHRILGTSKEYITKYGGSLQEGTLYTKSFEVVLGNSVARKTNLRIGDTFASSHGLAKNALETHTEKPFSVTGILKPTGTVIDHLIITNLESIWEVHEHEEDPSHDAHEEDQGHDANEEGGSYNEYLEDPSHDAREAGPSHDEHKEDHDHGVREAGPTHDEHEEDQSHDEHEEEREITSLLIKFRNPAGALQMSRYIADKTTMQAALPKFEIERLIGFLGVGFQTINSISIAILVVAGLSIFISLLKTVRERKQELALLRTYGATTFQLVKLVFMEALFLSLLGSVLGWFLGRIGVWFFSMFIEDSYGYHFVFSFPSAKELFILALVILTTLLAAILASLSLFKLNVSKILADA